MSAEKSLRRAKLQRRFKKVVIVKRTVDKSLCLAYKAVNIFDIFGIFELLISMVFTVAAVIVTNTKILQ